MTRSETAHYVSTKLAAAGREREAFLPPAVGRLHALSGGNPRGVDRLATLALMAGAVRGLEVVTPDVVDGVAVECEGPWPELLGDFAGPLGCHATLGFSVASAVAGI